LRAERRPAHSELNQGLGHKGNTGAFVMLAFYPFYPFYPVQSAGIETSDAHLTNSSLVTPYTYIPIHKFIGGYVFVRKYVSACSMSLLDNASGTSARTKEFPDILNQLIRPLPRSEMPSTLTHLPKPQIPQTRSPVFSSTTQQHTGALGWGVEIPLGMP
jgi:hypothetical protein